MQQTSSIDTITRINQYILETNRQLTPAYQKNYEKAINRTFLDNKTCGVVLTEILISYGDVLSEDSIIKKMQQTSLLDTITRINQYILETNRQLTPAYQKSYEKAINRTFLDNKTCGVVLTEILISYGNVLSEDSIIKKMQQTSLLDTITIINQYIRKTNRQLTPAYQKNYKEAINRIFLESTEQYNIIRLHGDLVSNANIIQVYEETPSLALMNIITNYVRQHPDRNIILPVRADMIGGGNNAPAIGGVATEIHQYTDGIEPIALKTLELMLQDNNKLKQKFTIQDLENKFENTFSDKKYTQINNDKQKLEAALPLIASILNNDDLSWPPEYQSVERRWTIWLEQSFAEAAKAYDSGTDQLSCVKGIYERLFTGFRNLHPAFDLLYSYANIEKEFSDISYKLKNEKDQIVNKLINQHVKPEDTNYKEKVHSICKIILLNLFKDAKETISKHEDFSEDLPQTYKYIKNHLNSKGSILNISIQEKINKGITAFKDIKLTPHLTKCMVIRMDHIPTENTFPADIDIVIVEDKLYYKKDGDLKQITELNLGDQFKDDRTIENVQQYIENNKFNYSILSQELYLHCDMTLRSYITENLEKHYEQKEEI